MSPGKDARNRARELVQWWDTGILPDGALRQRAGDPTAPWYESEGYSPRSAEHELIEQLVRAFATTEASLSDGDGEDSNLQKTQIAPDTMLRSALERRDAKVEPCPYMSKRYTPPSDKACQLCGANSSEPCRKRVIADAEFVDEVRQAPLSTQPKGEG